jgi:hypothetical protein
MRLKIYLQIDSSVFYCITAALTLALISSMYEYNFIKSRTKQCGRGGGGDAVRSVKMDTHIWLSMFISMFTVQGTFFLFFFLSQQDRHDAQQ